MLGSSLLCGLSLIVAGRGYSSRWLLLLWGSGSRVCRLQELWCMGLIYSLAWGSSQTGDQTHVSYTGQADSLPVSHQGSPLLFSSWIIMHNILTFFSVQFSRSVVSNSLRPHDPPPCPSPTLGVYPNSCPLSRWCHPTISSSVVPFSSCPQSFPASGSFPMRQLFASGGQSIIISASTSVLPMNSQDWSPLEWTGWISLQSKGLSRVFSNTTVQKHQFFGAQLSL